MERHYPKRENLLGQNHRVYHTKPFEIDRCKFKRGPQCLKYQLYSIAVQVDTFEIRKIV